MDTARESLKVPKEGSEYVSRLTVPPHRANVGQSFYESFTLKGIRVDKVEPGFLSCTFKVPLRLTTANGELSSGAIASLVDEIGYAVVHVEGQPMSVSVDMSISFLSTAKVNDELEISSRALGQRGRYSGTAVLLRNKSTGEVIAEGRHSLFSVLASKI
ncbi:hypothetical protein Syun_000361 [Stephania yunnanensis]|uniref:Acyl-coenzyme A thioesterase 13 n=1 Tax=Stephania yunnanensis TaxID=152371 RepID=A0AAP0Q9U1_9MAGN